MSQDSCAVSGCSYANLVGPPSCRGVICDICIASRDNTHLVTALSSKPFTIAAGSEAFSRTSRDHWHALHWVYSRVFIFPVPIGYLLGHPFNRHYM